MIQRVPLSPVEEALVAMVLEEHAALIRMADQKRAQRMAPLLAEKAIPEGLHVRVEKSPGDVQAVLVFDDGEPTPSVAEVVSDAEDAADAGALS